MKKLLKRVWTFMQSCIRQTKAASCLENTEAPTLSGSKLLTGVSSIKDLPLSDFIDHVCYGTEIANKEKLISEYYFVIEDETATNYVKIVSAMLGIELRAAYIDFVTSAIKNEYTEELAELLRGEDRRFTFSRETYLDEVDRLIRKEMNSKVHYDALKLQYDELNKKTKGEQKPDELYRGFRNTIFEVNKHEGYAAITLKSSTYDYAMGVLRLKKHISELEKKNNNAR